MSDESRLTATMSSDQNRTKQKLHSKSSKALLRELPYYGINIESFKSKLEF